MEEFFLRRWRLLALEVGAPFFGQRSFDEGGTKNRANMPVRMQRDDERHLLNDAEAPLRLSRIKLEEVE